MPTIEHPDLGTLTFFRTTNKWKGAIEVDDFARFGWEPRLPFVFDELDANGNLDAGEMETLAAFARHVDGLGERLLRGFWQEIHGEHGETSWSHGLEDFNERLDARHQILEWRDLARVIRPTGVAVFPSYWDNALQDIYIISDKEHVDPEHGFVLLCNTAGELVGTGPECEAERYDAFNSEAGLARKEAAIEDARRWNEQQKARKR